MPKFHCPRCRDHYYGLTPYPCDEELARLMREGLWRTGEATSPDKSIRRGLMRASLSETNIQKKRNSSSNNDVESSSKIKLPPINSSNNNSNNITSSHDTTQGNMDGLTSTGDRTKKRTKKISFALDNDFAGSPSTSNTSLTGSDGSSNVKGRKRRIGNNSKKGNLQSNKGSLTGLDDTSPGSNSSLDRFGAAGHRKKSDNQSSTSKLINSQVDVGTLKERVRHDGNSLSTTGSNKDLTGVNIDNALDGAGGTNDVKGKGKGLGDMHMSARAGLNADGSSTTMLTDETTMTNSGTSSSNKNATNGSSSADGDNLGVNSKYGDKSASDGTGGSGSSCNIANCQNKTISSTTAGADGSGRKTQKAPPGYMRAASPSQSEWGDPTHAKKWINNVAPPQPTFRYNDNDNDDYDDNFSSQVFNPRGWRHQQKKSSKPSSDDPLLLPVGPTFTRAFTFSYMPGASNNSSVATGGSKKSSRKKTT